MLLGAGISRSTGVKTAWEVLQELIRRASVVAGETVAQDPITWWTETTGEAPTYPAVLAEVASTQDERRALLTEFFVRSPSELADGVKVPSEGHQAVARLVAAGLVRVILTTNFDLLVEEALRANGIEPVVASTPEAIEGMEPLHAQRCVVVHLHGDYLNPGILNTEDELGSYAPATERRIQQVFDEYGLIVIGWSAAWDRALVALLKAAAPPRYASWWVEPGPLSPHQVDLVAARSAEHIGATADAGLTAIADTCDALADLKARSDPIAAGAAVAAAKGDLARPGPSIRTHDRLRAELERVASCETVRPLNFDGDSSERERRVDGLLGTSEVALALVASVAYWGDEATDRWWFGSIERFAHRQHVSGDTLMINLARAPAVLVMYAAGVAATAAERWGLVGRLLTEPVTETHTGGQLLPVALALRPDDVGLPGGALRVSRVLWPLFVDLLGLDVAAYVDAWERFEYLHHLTYADARLRAVDGIYGGMTGWLPHMRAEGLGASESRATPDLWFEHEVLSNNHHPLLSGGWLPPQNARNAQLDFARSFAEFTRHADDELLGPRGGMLPSNRHYPGSYDEDPRPPA